MTDGGHVRRTGPETVRPVHPLRSRLSEDVVRGVLAVAGVRADEVARARALLLTTSWCRAEEVASELVDCYVGRRMP